MKNHIKKLKAHKKTLVTLIKTTDNDTARWLFRHIHIADCLLRGRTMEQIEHKNRDGNEPNPSLYQCFMEETDTPEIPGLYLNRYFTEKVLVKEPVDESA